MLIQRMNLKQCIAWCNSMAVSLNNNAQTFQSSEDQAKGFLYKIKNKEGRTISYLCGTIHDLPSHPPLHDKIYKSLSKSQTLYVEISLLDKQTAVEYLQTSESLSEISEQKIQKIAEQEIAEIKKNPKAVEDRLTLKALSLGLEIKSLETKASRKAAKQAIANEMAVLKNKKSQMVNVYLLEAARKFNEAFRNIEIPDFDIGFQLLLKGYQALLEAVRHDDSPEEYRSPDMSTLIDRYERFFDGFAPGLGSNIKETIKALHVPHDIVRSSEVQVAWKLGDEKTRVESQVRKTIIDSRLEHLRFKKLYLRDLFMVDRIHNSLSLLEPLGEKRNFYAVGCAHLLDNYENLKKMLEQKGWKIVNAYTAPV